MNAKIDPKVVMDLSIKYILDGTVCNPSIKICWKSLLMRTNLGLLIGIPSRDPFLGDRVLGKTLCEFGSADEEIDVSS